MKLLAVVIAVLWLLITERLLFLAFSHRRLAGEALVTWKRRADPHSWNSEQVREAMISRLNDRAWGSVPFIKALVAVCPLLGLLGTVTGMIRIFDVLSVVGTTNARSIAEGVSRATITTMAGMVAALAGLFGIILITRNYEVLRGRLRDGFSEDLSQFADRSFWNSRFRFPLPSRSLVSAITALLVTAALLSLMQVLIKTGREAITEIKPVYFADFVRIRDEEPPTRKTRKPKKPLPAETPPDFQQPRQALSDVGGDNALSVAMPAIDVSGDGAQLAGLGGMPVSDGEYLPVVKVQAMYPRRAVAMGLEGYVLVEFTVTTTGAVRNPVVIESSHQIFERPALQAALKFKYKPKVVDGVPIEVHGVINKIIFEIENL